MSKNSYVGKIKPLHKMALGVGDLGYCLVSNTMSSFILFFGNAVMGVPGTLMGLAVACGTLWDAFTDPLVGYWSDNCKSKIFGRRHGFILCGIIFMAIVNMMLWSVPGGLSVGMKFAWFAVGIVILETCHTLFATPNAALSIEISSDYNERSGIQAVKSIFFIIGMLLPTLLMGVFQKSTVAYPDGRFNPQSYINFAFLSSSAAIVFGLFMFMITFSHIPRLKASALKEEGGNIKKPKIKDIFIAFFSTLKNVNFRSIVIGYSVAMMAATFLITVGFHVFTFTFKTTTLQMYILMASLFVMTMIGQPLWLWLSKKYDKRKSLLIGLSVSLCGCLLMFIMFLLRKPLNEMLTTNFAAVFLMTPPLIIAGLGTGVLYSMPLALIGDTLVIEKAETKQERTGTYTGFMTLAYKGSQAVSQVIIGILLDTIGFKEGSLIQTPKVESGLGLMLCLGVIISIVGGIIIFSKFSIKKSDVNAILMKTNEKKTER